MANTYMYSTNAVIIVGAGADNTLQDSIKKGFVINADTGRITINGVKLESENGLSNIQKQVMQELVEGSITSPEGNDYRFTDSDGNVIARISKEGLRTVGVKVTNSLGRIVGAFNSKTCGKIFGFPYSRFIKGVDDESFTFCDKEGNTVAKIDKDGIHAVAFYNAAGTKIG